MKTLLALLKNGREGIPTREKPRREKRLPSDWSHVVWEGNYVIMNHYPVWGHQPAKFMEEKMHKAILKNILELERLPTLEEIKKSLRTDDTKRVVREIFREKAKREMHDVDFEVGIQVACNLLIEPTKYEVPGVVEKVRKGIMPAGVIIQSFYSADYRA